MSNNEPKTETPSLSFDLDASEQDLLDEFGLLMAAEYCYAAQEIAALSKMDFRDAPPLRKGVEPVRLTELAERFELAKGC